MPEWLAETPWWVVVGLTITLAVALFKAARWTASTDKRLDSLESIVRETRDDIKLLFQGQKETSDDIKLLFQGQKETSDDIKLLFQGQKEIRDDIKMIFKDQTVELKSPIQLTDFGKKIADNIRASDWSEKFVPEIVDKTIGKEEFEIFEICVEHISEKYNNDPDFQKVVRANAYQHGTDIENVLKVQQVRLRDSILEKLEV